MPKNVGVLPGDVIFSNTVAPGLTMIQVGDPSTGYPLINAQPGGAYGVSGSAIAISPDESQLAWIGSSTPRFRIYALDGASALQQPAPDLSGTPNGLTWRPGGDQIAAAHATSPFLTRYSYPDLSKLAEVDVLPPVTTRAIGYSRDGAMLAVGFHSSSYTSPGFRLYDAINGTKLTDPETGLGSNCVALDFSPDGEWLVMVPYTTTYSTAAPRRYRVSNLDESYALVAANNCGSSLTKHAAFSADGSKFAFGGSASPYVRVYQTSDWTQVPTPPGLDSSAVTGLAWLSDDVLLVNQTSLRAIDYDDHSDPVNLGILTGGSSATSLTVRNGGRRRRGG